MSVLKVEWWLRTRKAKKGEMERGAQEEKVSGGVKSEGCLVYIRS